MAKKKAIRKKKQTSVYFEAKDAQRLSELSSKTHISQAWHIRTAVSEYLDRQK